MKKIRKKSLSDILLDIFIYSLMIFILLLTVYPVWYVIVASFSNSADLLKNPGVLLWPKQVVYGAYQLAFKNPLLMHAFGNTLKILGISLPINIVMTLLCGYFMACSGMKFKKPIVIMILFTMYFSGGLIPAYLNIRSLGLYNTLWAVILPGAMSVYNAIICKTSIEAIPSSLAESAYLDGASDLQVLFKIVMPLIKATLAVLILYYGVGHWNNWFTPSIYLRENKDLPVQNILRAILLANQDLAGDANAGDNYNNYAESIKYAAIVITTVPVMCIYPFLQKYFAKGALIGAVKG